MYINPFLAGVFSTIFIEVVAVIIAAVAIGTKKKVKSSASVQHRFSIFY